MKLLQSLVFFLHRFSLVRIYADRTMAGLAFFEWDFDYHQGYKNKGIKGLLAVIWSKEDRSLILNLLYIEIEISFKVS